MGEVIEAPWRYTRTSEGRPAVAIAQYLKTIPPVRNKVVITK